MDTMDLSMDALATEAAEKIAPPPKPEPPLIKRTEPITVTVLQPDGSEKRAVITSTVPGIKEKQKIGLTFASLTSGAHRDTLPGGIAEYLYAYAYIANTTDDRPAWFNEACSVDDDLVMAVYEEVIAHRAMFLFGKAAYQAGSSDPQRQRIVVASVASAPNPGGAVGTS